MDKSHRGLVGFQVHVIFHIQQGLSLDDSDPPAGEKSMLSGIDIHFALLSLFILQWLELNSSR